MFDSLKVIVPSFLRRCLQIRRFVWMRKCRLHFRKLNSL